VKPHFDTGEVRLGLGLIGIGKPWGYVPGEVPPEAEVRRFLEGAFQLGIRYFDTAASYGCSEQRLGDFLRTLTPAARASITVATKFGEHWDEAAGEPYVDHSFSALARSLERSRERLGEIDVLQLHKTTPAALASDEVARAWEMARGLGIPDLGASVSDAESARLAIDAGVYTMLQAPFNRAHPRFASAFEAAGRAGMWVASNRPLEMGRIAAEATADGRRAALQDAFGFAIAAGFRGVVLSGTRVLQHLEENLAAFAAAYATLRG
jgi:aryl-alcohol dehydrogenase-like predicted oxidoreductase